MHSQEYWESLLPVLDPIMEANLARHSECDARIAELDRPRFLAVTAAACGRNFEYRSIILGVPTDPGEARAHEDFMAATAGLISATWEIVRTGVEADSQSLLTILEFDDDMWFHQGSLLATVGTWADWYQLLEPSTPRLFAEYLRNEARYHVPHSVYHGRRGWREATFGPMPEPYDFERLGPPYMGVEQDALRLTSPLADVPLDWVMRDVEFALSVEDPAELLVLRERAVDEAHELLKWKNLLLDVEFQQDGPLTVDEIWPQSAYEMIDELRHDFDATFPTVHPVD